MFLQKLATKILFLIQGPAGFYGELFKGQVIKPFDIKTRHLSLFDITMLYQRETSSKKTIILSQIF